MKIRSVIALLLSLFIIITVVGQLFIDLTCFAIDDTDADIYRKKENDYYKIALTFDDGPHPRYTPEILDILDMYNIKATFFAVGINAKNYPEALAEVVKRGHEVGNHTYTHPHLFGVGSSDLMEEIEHCESEIYGLCERKTKLFRPPEGTIDSSITTILKKLDYKVILWDIDTRDWDHTPPTSIAENVVASIRSGDIILMHDYIGHNSPTPEALKIFLPLLIEKGYQFVTVSELIGLR